MDTSTQPASQTSDVFMRLGMAAADDATKQQIADSMAEIAMDKLIGKASDTLSETDMAYIEGLVDAGTPEKVEEALRERMPNFDEVLAGIMADVENQLVADQRDILAEAREKATQG